MKQWLDLPGSAGIVMSCEAASLFAPRPRHSIGQPDVEAQGRVTHGTASSRERFTCGVCYP